MFFVYIKTCVDLEINSHRLQSVLKCNKELYDWNYCSLCIFKTEEE